jgi:hypothetical protein
MRWLGLDIHKDFAEIAEASPGGVVRRLGRIRTTPTELRAFAESLGAEDQVAMEATINTFAIARLLEEHAGRVVVSNPLRTRVIADAKIKTAWARALVDGGAAEEYALGAITLEDAYIALTSRAALDGGDPP